MSEPSKLPFGNEQTLSGDELYNQLQNWLNDNGKELPETPRRPDVRLIVNNPGPDDIKFKNPGGHANEEENIPGEGDKTAAMIMVHGNTLSEQQTNASTLNERYNLTDNGFSPEFLEDLRSGALSDLVKEAYGPAPLEGQAKKLESVSWANDDGSTDDIEPVKGENAAFGARPPSNEKVFIARVSNTGGSVNLKGTDTSAERMTDSGSGYKAIAVGVNPVLDDNWQPTGEYTTKPIALSVARDIYGQSYNSIPVADLDQNGKISSISLNPSNNGQGFKPSGHDFEQ